MQFAGHLRGRALQEWNLLSDEERATFDTAVKSLRGRIDASSKAVAAQDFRHLRQGDPESVSDLMTWSDCSIPAPRPVVTTSTDRSTMSVLHKPVTNDFRKHT